MGLPSRKRRRRRIVDVDQFTELEELIEGDVGLVDDMVPGNLLRCPTHYAPLNVQAAELSCSVVSGESDKVFDHQFYEPISPAVPEESQTEISSIFSKYPQETCNIMYKVDGSTNDYDGSYKASSRVSNVPNLDISVVTQVSDTIEFKNYTASDFQRIISDDQSPSLSEELLRELNDSPAYQSHAAGPVGAGAAAVEASAAGSSSCGTVAGTTGGESAGAVGRTCASTPPPINDCLPSPDSVGQDDEEEERKVPKVPAGSFISLPINATLIMLTHLYFNNCK